MFPLSFSKEKKPSGLSFLQCRRSVMSPSLWEAGHYPQFSRDLPAKPGLTRCLMKYSTPNKKPRFVPFTVQEICLTAWMLHYRYLTSCSVNGLECTLQHQRHLTNPIIIASTLLFCPTTLPDHQIPSFPVLPHQSYHVPSCIKEATQLP